MGFGTTNNGLKSGEDKQLADRSEFDQATAPQSENFSRKQLLEYLRSRQNGDVKCILLPGTGLMSPREFADLLEADPESLTELVECFNEVLDRKSSPDNV